MAERNWRKDEAERRQRERQHAYILEWKRRHRVLVRRYREARAIANAAYRRQEYDRAMAEVEAIGDELALLVKEQEQDGRRQQVQGAWVVSLDEPLWGKDGKTMRGSDRGIHLGIVNPHSHSAEWADPTGEAAVANVMYGPLLVREVVEGRLAEREAVELMPRLRVVEGESVAGVDAHWLHHKMSPKNKRRVRGVSNPGGNRPARKPRNKR